MPLTQLQLRPWLKPGRWLIIGVGLAMLIAVLLPLNLLATQRFHHDEALYTTWALKIASGENPYLIHTPIDKPPLFLYTVAGSLWLWGSTETATRLPSLLATWLSVGLTFWLGRKLYNNGVGLLAAWLMAVSPFTILFAPTAFTDPMLVTLVLAGCVAAAYGRAGFAGIFLGLAIAAKQQGIFFIPLGFLLLIANLKNQGMRNTLYTAGRFLAALLLTLLPVFLWDILRDQSPGLWQLSLINYGGLDTTAGQLSERWWGFVELLTYATASPILNIIFIIGLPLLLGYSKINRRSNLYHDWIFTLFILGFLLLHTWLSFRVWDRYLLGLIPFLALLLARILLLPWSFIKTCWLNKHSHLRPLASVVFALALACFLGLTLAQPIQDAVNGRYPLGSHSNALSGIDQIVAYLQSHTDSDTTLYHRWLGTHWRFYLAGYPYDLQYWPSAEHLADRAQAGHLIAFPTWHSQTEARLALADQGLDLKELTRAYTPAGNPSIILYQISKRKEQ